MSDSPTPAARARLFTANYLILFTAQLFFMLSTSIYYLLPRFLELKGTSQGFYGAVAGTVGLASFASGVLLGHRADRWGRKITVNVCLVPAFVGNVVAVLALEAHPAWYFLTRGLQGVTMGLGFPLIYTWVAELSPPGRHTEALAYFGMSGLAANTAGPLLGELILAAQPDPHAPAAWWLVFLAATLLYVGGVLLFQLPPSTRPPADGRDEGGLLPLLRRRKTRRMMAIVVCFGGVFGVLMAFGKNYAASLGLSFATALYAAFTLGAIASRLFIRALIRHVTQSHIIPAALAGIALSFVLLGLARGYPLLAASGLVYGLSHGVLYPALTVRFFEFHTGSELGRASILFSGAFSAGAGLLPYLGGKSAETIGFSGLYFALAAVALIALALHFSVEREMRREHRG